MARRKNKPGDRSELRELRAEFECRPEHVGPDLYSAPITGHASMSCREIVEALRDLFRERKRGTKFERPFEEVSVDAILQPGSTLHPAEIVVKQAYVEFVATFPAEFRTAIDRKVAQSADRAEIMVGDLLASLEPGQRINLVPSPADLLASNKYKAIRDRELKMEEKIARSQRPKSARESSGVKRGSLKPLDEVRREVLARADKMKQETALPWEKIAEKLAAEKAFGVVFDKSGYPEKTLRSLRKRRDKLEAAAASSPRKIDD
jgi:hypothetical protein